MFDDLDDDDVTDLIPDSDVEKKEKERRREQERRGRRMTVSEVSEVERKRMYHVKNHFIISRILVCEPEWTLWNVESSKQGFLVKIH